MANVLTNFLVGLGLDTTEFDKGTKTVESGINNIKSNALQLASIAAGAFGVHQLTVGFAQAKDELGKFSQVFSIAATDVQAFGLALEHEGGSLEGFMSQIRTLESLRALNPGQLAGLFAEAGIQGIDPSVILDAENAKDAYLGLADVFKDLDQLERLKAAELFGIDEAGIRLLSKGSVGLESSVEQQKVLRPVTDEMTESAGVFNSELQDLFTNIGSVADIVSVKLLPAINGIIGGLNDWLEANKEWINGSIGGAIDFLTDNIVELTTAIIALKAAGISKAVSAAGDILNGGESKSSGGKFKRVLSKVPLLGVVPLAAEVVNDVLSNVIPGYDDADAAFTGFVNDILDYNPSNDLELNPPTTISPYAQGVSPTQSQSSYGSYRQRPIRVEASLNLDGQVLDRRIIDVNERQYEDAISDVTSSTGG